jgi:iron complex transport system ATP-binding protein
VSDAALTCQGLSFAYPKGAPVVRDLTCRFYPGRMTAILGPNGAGKSTLLRLLAGLIPPSQGQIHLGTTPLADLSPRARARRLAFVSQRPSLAFDFTVWRVVQMGRYAQEPRPDIIAQALEAVDLATLAERPYHHLSAGQQQRVSIARALAQLGGPTSPTPGSLLLADEPLAALDPRHALHTIRLFQDLANKGLGIVFVLHDLSEARRVAHDALLLGPDGSAIAQGTSADVLTPGRLKAAFEIDFLAANLSTPDRADLPVILPAPTPPGSP